MKQILNIITKDVRDHWFEVAASMALMVAFAWIEIHGWTHQDAMAVGFSGFFVYRILLQLVVVLVPLSWMFLIVRVVHGESLVGDRQFWVTRPYDWKKFVVAKALFVLPFINLPLFVLDVFLLVKGGFQPSSHVPGLFWMQLLLILALFLPTAALTVITAGLGQMLLALLIVALYMIGMAALSNLVPNSDYSGGNDSWLGIVLIGTALAVILLQYSTRKTARSRWLIVSLAAALTLLLIATPYRSLMARDYPLPDTSSLKFALLPGHPPGSRRHRVRPRHSAYPLASRAYRPGERFFPANERLHYHSDELTWRALGFRLACPQYAPVLRSEIAQSRLRPQEDCVRSDEVLSGEATASFSVHPLSRRKSKTVCGPS